MTQKTQKQIKLEIAEGINSINDKFKLKGSFQYDFSTWDKDYVEHDEHNAEPVDMFPSDRGGIEKSHLVRLIYYSISKTLLSL